MISHSANCPDCGQAMDIPYDDTLEWEGPNAAAYLKAVEKMRAWVICDDCLKRREGSEVQRKIAMSARAARSQSYGLGWMPKDAASETFANSRRDLEARTAGIEDAFAWGRGWQPLQPKRSAWISGQKGTGKTFFAHCLANHAISLGKTAMEVRAIDIQQHGIAWMDGKKALEQIRRVDFLIVEEIGLPTWRKEGVVTLREIIDFRHRLKLATVITGNLTAADIKPVWLNVAGADVISPMFDRMTSFTGFEFKGESLRRAV